MFDPGGESGSPVSFKARFHSSIIGLGGLLTIFLGLREGYSSRESEVPGLDAVAAKIRIVMQKRKKKITAPMIALLSAYALAAFLLEHFHPSAEIFPVFSWSLFSR